MTDVELPVHPGAVLREEYLKPLSMSANALAKAPSVPAPSINEVVRERRSISADTDMRVARYFGGDGRSKLNLHGAYDLRVAEISNAKRIAREVSPTSQAPTWLNLVPNARFAKSFHLC